MGDSRTKIITKIDWTVAVLSMFLTFFINEFYKVQFQFDSTAIARTSGTATVPTLFGWIFLVFFYRKIKGDLFWAYLIVMACAGFMGDGVWSFNTIRDMGKTIEEANKAMGIATIVFVLIACLIYGVLRLSTNTIKNLLFKKRS